MVRDDRPGRPGERDRVQPAQLPVDLFARVMPVRRSATRISSSASQQSSTCVRMRAARSWTSGRGTRVRPRSGSCRPARRPRRQLRVRGRQQVLPVQPRLGGDLRPVQHEPPGRGFAQPAPAGGVLAQRTPLRLVGTWASVGATVTGYSDWGARAAPVNSSCVVTTLAAASV